MKLGDVVKFIGFENYRHKELDNYYGIVIAISRKRVDVLWGTGIIGRKLFQETLAIVSQI